MIYLINILIFLIHVLLLKTILGLLELKPINVAYWVVLILYVFLAAGYEYIRLKKKPKKS